MQKILIGAIILASLLAGMSAYLLFRNSPSDESVVPVPTPIVTESEVELPTTGTDSLMALATLGHNLECTISYETEAGVAGKTEGTYFTSLGRMRGDFMVAGVPDGGVSSMILKDGVMYSWTEISGEKYGMKVELSAIPEANTPDTREPVPLEAEVSYTCKPWANVDGSIFEVPADIIFTDYSAVMNQGMEYGTTYTAPQADCSACASLTGEYKKQCLVSLQCE